ncbi:cupin [Paenibacillus sp. BIHB 4019]|uniref:Cupin n=1 Tax=Paenibacillus sp. BIHB 4019 TaxID=1870819 RepID=A0A1B2DNR1_9BACL|nr:cupin domain-containing protein [Paenibacillus sp. BIHB 4019]ANY69344.1 cupin [Paenibacillus sp. BIHB 4019]
MGTNIDVWESAEPGVKRKILTASGQLMTMEVHFEAGAVGRDHNHVHEQISYCLWGQIEYHLGDETRLLLPGDVIYVPSGVKHGVTALESSALLDIFTPIREDLLR